MIAVIDYGVGNLFSVSYALDHLGYKYSIVKNEAELKAADRIILPGVGAFGDAMQKMNDSQLTEPLLECVKKGTPLLGICLGMQLLYEKSYEYGEHTGLGLLKGSISPIEPDVINLKQRIKVPHMGWNSLCFKQESPILKSIKNGSYVYYVHSYYAKDCSENQILATSDYGVEIPGAVQNNNVFGCQFHPEKSGNVGLGILKDFCEL